MTSQHNILVDNGGVACISEYGLEIVLRDEASPKSIPSNARWTAPEVLSTRDRRVPSRDDGKAADVYSFAMVMFEVRLPTFPYPSVYRNVSSLAQILTGTAPFQCDSDEEITDKVSAGLRPERPSNNHLQGMLDKVWEQITGCWNQKPDERPVALKVLRALGEGKHRELAVSAEDSDDGMIMREWDWVEGEPQESTFFCLL